MTRAFSRSLRAAAVAVLVLVSSPVSAGGTGLDGFNVLTVHPAADGSGLFSLYGTQTLGHLEPALRFTLQGIGGLVETVNPVNSNRADLVGDIVEGDLSAAVGLSNRLDLGMTLPIVFYEKGMDANTQARFTAVGVGDLLLDAKARILEDTRGSVGLGVLARLTLPTGDPGRFTGWSGPTGEFRLLADKTIASFFAVANVGYRVAGRSQVVNRASGASWNVADDDRLTFGMGLAYALPVQRRSWSLFAAVEGETVTGNLREITTPVEVRGGVEKRFGNGLALQIGGGRGVTDALGSPSYRVFAGISFDGGRRHRSAQRASLAAQVVRELRETVFFGFDDARLSEHATAIVDRAAEVMQDSSDLKASIAGHTDALGRRVYNEALSRQRAEAVTDRLTERGVGRQRISITAFGETQPFGTNATPDGRGRNRRVEIVVQR